MADLVHRHFLEALHDQLFHVSASLRLRLAITDAPSANCRDMPLSRLHVQRAPCDSACTPGGCFISARYCFDVDRPAGHHARRASGVNVSYSCFQNCRKSASKMMSASRIWPVVGFTRDGPIAKPAPAVIQRNVL